MSEGNGNEQTAPAEAMPELQRAMMVLHIETPIGSFHVAHPLVWFGNGNDTPEFMAAWQQLSRGQLPARIALVNIYPVADRIAAYEDVVARGATGALALPISASMN